MSDAYLLIFLVLVLLLLGAVVLYRIGFVRGAVAEQAELRRLMDMIPPDRRRAASQMHLINDRRAPQ